MLTLDKMQKNQYFDVQKVRNMRAEYFDSYLSFSLCTHSSVYQVFWPSDRVVDCNILILFRLSATDTMPLTTQTLHTATKRCVSPQTINRNMQIFYSFAYLYSSLCDAIKP